MSFILLLFFTFSPKLLCTSHEINVPYLLSMSCLMNFETPLELPDKLKYLFLEPLSASVRIYIFSNLHCLFLSTGSVIPNIQTKPIHFLLCHCLNIYSTPVCNCGSLEGFSLFVQIK